MKKSLFLVAAASALLLTACSSDNDVLQSSATQLQQSAPKGVGFDVYTQNATNVTRSGRTNVMDNSTLQITGFGVFGYQDEGTPGAYDTGSKPNFMWNQHVNYISSAWSYSPLKYWPNETAHDSQSTQAQMDNLTNHNKVEVLSFFAYAPWVKATPADGSVESVYTYESTTSNSITGFTTNATAGDTKINYTVATNPSQSVDLLWGVAPVGDLVYTAVDGSTVTIKEGMPLIDLKKPAVNTSMKFLFQHALARLGVKVVLAADQVSAGGNFDVANSKVTIEEIAIKGNFGTAGTLNLNNTSPNKANWESVTTAASDAFVINATNGLAAHLKFNSAIAPGGASPLAQQAVTGVTTTYSDAIQVSNIPGYSKLVTTPAYSATTPYFADGDDHEETPTYAAYAAQASTFDPSSGDSIYLQKNVLSNAYTAITPSTTYPNATVWSNIYSIHEDQLVEINAGNKVANAAKPAYRKHGDTYYPTGQAPLVGEYVIEDANLHEVTLGRTASNYYLANSNYFMIIPPTAQETEDKTIKVKITYWVSTKDPNVAGGVVYTKNEVEKAVVLPHLKNGVAYNLKLILGMTSVKLEAEATDWTTTTSEINLPQNTAE